MAGKRISVSEQRLANLYDRPLRVINDIMFKAVFAPKGHEPQLRELLNELLGYEGSRRITGLTRLDGAVHARRRRGKQPIMDLLVEDASGRRFVVEVQRLRAGDFVARSVYYATSVISNSLGAGESFGGLSPTIVVSLLDFRLFDDHERVQTRGILWDPDAQRPLTDLLELNFFELPKHGLSDVSQLVTLRDKWLHVLHFGERYLEGELPPQLACEENIRMAIKHYREASGDLATRVAAIKLEVDERSRIGQLHEARQEGREEGREEGIQIGEQRGIQIGEHRGVERGEHRKAVETARRMAVEGLEPGLISRVTGLLPEEWQ